jgi:acetyl esterase/lipase
LADGLDPKLFSPEAIDAETAAFNARLAESLAATTPTHLQAPAAVRAEREAGRGPQGPIVRSPNAQERLIPGPAGDLSLRLFIPQTVRGVYYHIHGGGWVLGSNDAQDPRLEQIANDCSVAVASVGYRLAPEDRHPAGADDCEAAALWLVEHAQAEFGSDRLVIGGESAGACFAVVTLARLRDRHGLTPFRAANLPYGLYDASMTPSAARWGDRYLGLSTPVMRWFANHYAPASKWRDPDVSPLYGDLSRLPSALFTVGTKDVLLDDTLFMYARWIAAASSAELAVYPGGAHGFTNQPLEIGRRALARQHDFIRAALA